MVFLIPAKRYKGTLNDPRQASFDHFISKSNGGGGTKENTVIACRDCNSKKGSENFEAEFGEKLRLLNIKRGYGDTNGVVCPTRIRRMLRPDEFSITTTALSHLCDLANDLKDDEGLSIRSRIARRLQKHQAMIKALSAIPDLGLRRETMRLLFQKRQADQRARLDDLMERLIGNVMAAMINEHFRKVDRKRKKKGARKLRAREQDGSADGTPGSGSDSLAEAVGQAESSEKFASAEDHGKCEDRAHKNFG